MASMITLPFREFYKWRDLIFYLVRAELKEKQFQKALGPIWWFGEPILMSVIYILLTTVLFRQTFEEHYQISIIMAVLTWRWFSRSVDRAPNLLLGFQFELKKTNLPILPNVFTYITVELVFFTFALAVIMAGILISGVNLTIYALFVPFLMLIQLVMIVAFSTVLARLGVFFKDIGQIIWVGTAIWFYLSPGIYPASIIPEKYLWLYNLNPFATIFPAWRNVLIDGSLPDLLSLSIWLAIFLPFALLGMIWLHNSRKAYFRRL
jgi:lipopolysaccharide transport system permease protein